MPPSGNTKVAFRVRYGSLWFMRTIYFKEQVMEFTTTNGVGVMKKFSRTDRVREVLKGMSNPDKSAAYNAYVSQFTDDTDLASVRSTIHSLVNKLNGHTNKRKTEIVSNTLVEAPEVVENVEIIGNSVDAFGIPELNESYVITDQIKNLLTVVDKRTKNGQIMNVMLFGPHGCGKTELAQQFAAVTHRPFYETNAAFFREPRDFFGSKGAKNGTTYWKKSEIVRALQTPHCVVLLDEINRVTNPVVLNSLFSLTDHRRSANFDELGTVNVAEGVTIWSAQNRGAVYTGTGVLDRALLDRYTVSIECNYLEPDKEASVLSKRTGIKKNLADQLVKMAGLIRQKATGVGASLRESISTRTLIAVADLFKDLGQQAFDYTLLPHYSPEGGASSERGQVLQIINLVFGSV